jgi:polyphosphate kinase 2 (PPK2 family)
MTETQRADPGPHSVVPPGVWVDESDEDDPVLRNADGTMVDTWREDYPYAERLGRDEYEREKRRLQVELLKLQYWVQDSGCRIVVLFEGRDAAGKGSTWKLSPTDIALLDKWDAYTAAKVTMFQRTDTPEAPWTVIKSNDKKRARLEAMRSLLSGIDYDRKDPKVVGEPDPLIVGAPADLRELGNGKLSPTPLTKPHVARWPATP